LEPTQEQDEQVHRMGNNLVNAPNTNVAQRGRVDEQHQNVVKLIVQRDLAMFSTTHQETP
jgi:hypothetical protein